MRPAMSMYTVKQGGIEASGLRTLPNDYLEDGDIARSKEPAIQSTDLLGKNLSNEHQLFVVRIGNAVVLEINNRV